MAKTSNLKKTALFTFLSVIPNTLILVGIALLFNMIGNGFLPSSWLSSATNFANFLVGALSVTTIVTAATHAIVQKRVQKRSPANPAPAAKASNKNQKIISAAVGLTAAGLSSTASMAIAGLLTFENDSQDPAAQAVYYNELLYGIAIPLAIFAFGLGVAAYGRENIINPKLEEQEQLLSTTRKIGIDPLNIHVSDTEAESPKTKRTGTINRSNDNDDDDDDDNNTVGNVGIDLSKNVSDRPATKENRFKSFANFFRSCWKGREAISQDDNDKTVSTAQTKTTTSLGDDNGYRLELPLGMQ